MINIKDGRFIKNTDGIPSSLFSEKACPSCGKWFEDKTKNKKGIACSPKCTREARLSDPDIRLNELAWMRLKNLKNQHDVQFNDAEIIDIVRRLSLGKCEMCGGEFKFRQLHIDHDHYAKRLRGVICGHCNSVLGFAYDKVSVLMDGIKYLNNYSPVSR